MSNKWFTHSLAPNSSISNVYHPSEAHTCTATSATCAIIRPPVTASNPRGDLIRP